MAATEARLIRETGGCGNMELLAELPQLQRSLEAIKGKRREARYKERVQACLEELNSRVPVAAPCPPEAEVPTCTPDASVVEPTADEPAIRASQAPISADAMQALETLLQGAQRRQQRGGLGARAARRFRVCPQPLQGQMSAKNRRRMEYARVQELFRKCPGRAAAEVIDGHCRETRHSLEEMEAYWRPILEAASNAPGPTPEALRKLGYSGEGTPDYSQLWAPITVQEVKESRVDPRTAPGPDGIRPEDWRQVAAQSKAEIFNQWMTSGEIPEPLRQCRTIFVPKSDAPAGPGDYRPITIASIPLRHMHSILARRLLACCPPDLRQRGFVCADGTIENTAVLDAVLGDSRKRLKECHMAVLDFSKAFDTVSHAALCELLRARGLPEAFCEYVARLYRTASTTLAVKGQRSAPVKVGKGVRQGDPLSPLLFNMAMDLILANLPPGVGYGLEGERVSALAYADDLVLLAGSKVGMQESINCVVQYGEMMGLRVNLGKSSVLSMIPNGHLKKCCYLTGRTFSVGRQKLRQVNCVERWRYLGVDFCSSGSRMIESDVKVALANITSAPLKPQQRLEILRAHLVPRFLHGLVLGTISDDRLRMMDVQIRASVRKWLRLPHDVPVAYFHAAIKDGGLAIPSLRAVIPDLIVRRYGGLDSSRWGAARAAARSDRIRKKLRWASGQLRKFTKGAPRRETPSVTQYWRDVLHESTDGYELRESSRVPASTKWVRARCMEYSGRDYMQFVHVHINTLPSRVRTSRGRREGRESELNCRGNCLVRETTAHIVQQCWRTHGGRIERHDCVARYVADAMTRQGWTVRHEPRIVTALGLRKPDIIAARDGVGAIVDVQVVSGRQSLDDAHCAKRRKYGDHRELVEKVAGILGLPGPEFISATSCSISWRGVWSRGSYKEMKRLIGLPTECLERIPGLVLRGSHMNWNRFNQMTAVSAEAPGAVSGACG